jgi:predicted Zn-dependent protease with MMP-like domain
LIFGRKADHGQVIDVDLDTFWMLVERAMASIPEDLRRQMRNVSIVVDDLGASPNLLGLYQGVPLTKRTNSSYTMAMPDRITIYRLPILRTCNTPEDVVRQVRRTVLHEVAHHFGISDERLHEIDRY